MLHGKASCSNNRSALSMPVGSPQVTQTWVDTDGEHIIINTVEGYVNLEKLGRDLWVAVVCADPENPSRCCQVGERVIDIATNRGAEHIEQYLQKYTGQTAASYGSRDQVRAILRFGVDRIAGNG